MTSSATSPTESDPTSATGAVVVVATSASDVDASLERAFPNHSARRVVLLVLTGTSAEPHALRVTETRSFHLPRGAVAATPELVAGLRAALTELGAAVVFAPHPSGADIDVRATARAVASAITNGQRRTLVLYARGEASSPIEGRSALAELRRFDPPGDPALATTAVVSTWNKLNDVRANLEALRAQTVPFAEIVAVDNASRDGTAEMIAAEFPEVRLIRMPHDQFGACETFNIGFKASRTPLTAILDDDIVMPPDWLEKATQRIAREPATTAILSTQVVEPGMPEEYKNARAVNEERYMSTFRGCASLARSDALREAGYYDERLFIYGNERDLTCRLLNLGYRVLQYPGCGVFHKTPFGIKMGKRSLYYHARNAWLSMLKYAPLGDLVKMPWLVLTKVILRDRKREHEGSVRDATGTIGIGKSLRETKGAWWVVTKAAFSVLANVPYCLARRRPVKSPDFELPDPLVDALAATRAVNGGLGPVSVVVCNYNGERYLSECLASVAALDGVVDEVIVVDNASTDASRVIAERAGARVVSMSTNDGPCPARNAGMKAAKNRWVLALDNDAVCTQDMLAKLCAAVSAAEKTAPNSVAIAQPRSVFASEPSRVHYDGGAFHYVGLIALRNFYVPLSEAVGRGTLDVDCAVAVALLVDRDAVLALGGYDETMFILFEDLDLSYRLRACRKRILSVEDALVLHKGGTPGISFREGPSYPGSRVFFHSRNRWTFLAKCLRWRTLVVAAPGIVAYECVWFVFALASLAPHEWLRGKWRFVRLYGHIRRERARFQARRSVADKKLLAGGPLTITPALKSSAVKSFLVRSLDGVLRLWWRIARPFAA